MKFYTTLISALLLGTFAQTYGAENQGPAWGYEDDDPDRLSPEEWGTEYPACDGQRQSPIDIVSEDAHIEEDEQVPLTFSGDCVHYGLKSTPDTFKWEAVQDANSCKVHRGEQSFSLINFHLHMPSEHLLDGEEYDAEVHFVHKEDDQDGKPGTELLVIGLFVEKLRVHDHHHKQQHDHHHKQKHDHHHEDQHEEREYPWVDSVFDSLCDGVNSTVDVEYSYADLVDLKLGEGNVYNYPGSLTVPPCDENVDWWIIKSPVAVQSRSLKKMKIKLVTLDATEYGNQARPVQPLNDRQVVYHQLYL